MRAAIGADLPVTHPVSSMVVDIGGGTTEVGVISIGGMTLSTSVRVGGDKMDDAISSHVRRTHNLMIGEATAERVKKEIGTARIAKGKPVVTTQIKGRDVARGVPREISLSQAEVVEAITEHQEWMAAHGELAERRLRRAGAEIEAIAVERVRTRFGPVDQLAKRVVEGELDPFAAAEQLISGNLRQ